MHRGPFLTEGAPGARGPKPQGVDPWPLPFVKGLTGIDLSESDPQHPCQIGKPILPILRKTDLPRGKDRSGRNGFGEVYC